MSRTKFSASAALASAAIIVGGIALAGPAAATQTFTANCDNGYGTVSGSATKVGSNITVVANITAPVDIAANSILTTLTTNTGVISGTVNPEAYEGDPTVVLGPLSGATASTATISAMSISIAGTVVTCSVTSSSGTV